MHFAPRIDFAQVSTVIAEAYDGGISVRVLGKVSLELRGHSLIILPAR